MPAMMSNILLENATADTMKQEHPTVLPLMVKQKKMAL